MNNVNVLKARMSKYLGDSKITATEAYNLERLAKDGNKVTADEAAAVRDFFQTSSSAFTSTAKTRFQKFLGELPPAPAPSLPGPDATLASLIPLDEAKIPYLAPDKIDWRNSYDYSNAGYSKGQVYVFAPHEKLAVRELAINFDTIDALGAEKTGHPEYKDGLIGTTDLQFAATDPRLSPELRQIAQVLGSNAAFFKGVDTNHDGLISKADLVRAGVQNLGGFHAQTKFSQASKNASATLRTYLDTYNKKQDETLGAFGTHKTLLSRDDLQKIADNPKENTAARQAATFFLTNAEEFLAADTAYGYVNKDAGAVVPDGVLGYADFTTILSSY